MKTTLLLLFAVAGCQQAKPFPEEDFSELAALDLKSDLFSKKLRLVGSLRSDQERSHYLDDQPRFRGYSFAALTGERLEVTVKSSDGDAVTWLTDAKFHVLKRNDDADANTYDSRIGFEV